MTDDEARKMIDAYWDAFAAKDIPSAMTFFSDDAVYEDKAIEHVATGKAEIEALWRLYFDAASQGFEAEQTSCIVTSEGYGWAWTVKGRIDGAFGALQGTGQEISIQGASIGDIRDGKIVRNKDYWNLASVMRQVEGAGER
jgi:steroid delta-isomerase-like uncharacterized protein